MTFAAKLRRPIAIVATAALLAAGFVAVQSITTEVSAEALTYDPARFDPGNIISDSNFYDGGAMTATEVKTFLDGKISTTSAKTSCANIATSATPCLKDYRDDIRARSADANGCKAIAAKANQTAATIIATVAQACGISPKVILVTLQKEQGLVQSVKPTQWGYDHAMGWGCPDTAACETKYNGLFNQVYKGAWQFKQYRYNYLGFNYRKGQTVKIAYSPTSSCGSKSVTIQNWATAALYIYTPYTPNAAALKNYPGTATCGAYGNRNFWAYYNSWFGSSIVGGSLIGGANSAIDYLVVDDDRWRLPGQSNTELLSAYAPFGPRGAVSTLYLESFTNKGALGRIVRNPSDVNFFVDNGKRYTVGTCADVTNIGLPCTTVPELGWDQAGQLPNSAVLQDYVKLAGGAIYVLNKGTKHEFIDTKATTAAGISTSASTTLTASALNDVPLGEPILSDLALFKKTGTNDVYFVSGSTTWHISAGMFANASITGWFGNVSPRTLSAASIAQLPAIKELPPIVKNATTGKVFIIGAKGLEAVANPANWTATIVEVPAVILAKIPTTSTTRTLPYFVRSATTSKLYLLNAGTKTAVASNAARDALATKMKISNATSTVPDYLIDSIKTAAATPTTPTTPTKAGIAVRTSSTGKMWFLDGTKRIPITTNTLKETRGKSNYSVVTEAALAKYTAEKTAMTPGLKCGSGYWVQFGGKLHKISAKAAAEYKPRFAFRTFTTATCKSLVTHPKATGTLLVSASGKYYQIDNGKKRPMSAATYKKKKASLGAATTASTYILSLFPTGSTVK